jgi:hypothetical protein
VTTFFAPAGRIILKELHFISALGTFGLKNGPRLPIPAILSWAFHGFPPIDLKSDFANVLLPLFLFESINYRLAIVFDLGQAKPFFILFGKVFILLVFSQKSNLVQKLKSGASNCL